MKNERNIKQFLKEAAFTVIVLLVTFLLVLTLQRFIDTPSLIPMLFVLGVFIISLKTRGFLWGITASLIGVLLVNYAFTYPYYAIDLISPECLSSAIVMLIVSVMTGTLTTQIKKQEKMKSESEKERMRANLLRAVSHDLRTPLTTVYGSCCAIIENYDSLNKPQQLTLLSEMQKDSEWLIRMVENLLSVTRIDGKGVLIKKNPTVLEELIDTVLIKFKKRCPNQEVTVLIPDDFISIPMDPILIEQVLINLLENAVYHAAGMTELILSVKIKDSLAVFSVSDNGCGIKQEKLGDIFNGYAKHSDAPTDGTRNNMGIGLSVCAAIIKAHSGEITVRSEKDKGSVFSFSLKLEENTNGKQI